MKLGLSEAFAVNGNINSFKVTNNKVHDNNNNFIGIVLIGHEGVPPVAVLNQARNRIVRNNIIHHNSSNNKKDRTFLSFLLDLLSLLNFYKIKLL